jgi:hypothetical protein
MGLNLTYTNLIARLDELQASASGYTESDLIRLINDASVRVEGAPANATSLLYTGEIEGVETWKIAKQLAIESAGETGANRLVT